MAEKVESLDLSATDQLPIPVNDSLTTTAPSDPVANQSGESKESLSKSKSDGDTTAEKLRDLQDATLRFLANASNETLGACVVGLCASTYLVLGRVGLVLIGAVGGVFLHATWESNNGPTAEGHSLRDKNAQRRKELGVDIVKRALDWRTTNTSLSQDTKLDVNVDTSPKSPDFSEFQPATRDALIVFTDAVIRDYVHWWYRPLLPADLSFPSSCRQVLTSFILSFSNHLSRKRRADPFLDFLANSTSIIIVFLNELASALNASQKHDVENALKTYIQYQPDSNLANVISPEQQEQKLKIVADDILRTFLDRRIYDCPPTKDFLREVLAVLMLQSTVKSCSQAEWINGWIVYLLEEGEPEIMNVIDAGVEDMSQKIGTAQSKNPRTPQDKTYQRRMSRAEEAMEEAMREAQRLNEMIAEDEARRQQGLSTLENDDALSSATTTDIGMATPTSSDSDQLRQIVPSVESSLIFDSEGNMMPSGTSSPSKPPSSPFTSFDQLGSRSVPTALQPNNQPPAPTEVMVAVPLTLHNSSITILDMGEGNERAVLKQKPTDEMLIQIEPASSRYPGWMVSRKYNDFEPLHESLRRIAVVSGVFEFSQKYASLPGWKGLSRVALIQDLEIYLKSAVKFERLAESEVMKKFLDKQSGQDKAPSHKNVILQGGAALENVGKNVLNVLGQGGKGIQSGFQTGGKAVLGGVQGVFGAVATGVAGPKRPAAPSRNDSNTSNAASSSRNVSQISRFSQDSTRTNSALTDKSKPSPSPVRSPRASMDQTADSRMSLQEIANSQNDLEFLNLPPPPSEISNEFEPISRGTLSRPQTDKPSSQPVTPTKASRTAAVLSTQKALADTVSPSKSSRPQDIPITDEETRISVELMFAIITEVFSLSSAWTIRLSLLAAAKTFLLRPNNPQLDSIRALLQDSVVDANSSDAGIAAHILKLRENTLPTEEERAAWPKDLTAAEKDQLRIRARKLLVERGMPQALTSVMGSVASGEALGRVFDCLQVEEVARGLVFALMLQAVRAVIQ